MKYSELRKKEVISVKECRCLGHVCDLDFDECRGQICNISVPGCSWVCSLWKEDSQIVIPYHCIKQFGADIILVDV